MKWKDIDNNDTIDYRDMASLGSPTSALDRWFQYLLLAWKGFSLFARLDFAFGHIQQDFHASMVIGQCTGRIQCNRYCKRYLDTG